MQALIAHFEAMLLPAISFVFFFSGSFFLAKKKEVIRVMGSCQADGLPVWTRLISVGLRLIGDELGAPRGMNKSARIVSSRASNASSGHGRNGASCLLLLQPAPMLFHLDVFKVNFAVHFRHLYHFSAAVLSAGSGTIDFCSARRIL